MKHLNLRRLLQVAAIAIVGLALTVATAHATPIVRVNDGSGNVTIGLGNSVYNGWSMNITTLQSTNFGGAAQMDAVISAFNWSGTGILTIEISDTGFGPAPTINLTSSIGGETANTIRYQTYISTSNTLFAKTTLLGDTGNLVGEGQYGQYSASFDYVGGGAIGVYSITQVITVDHTNGTSLTDNFASGVAATPAPEPSSLVLLGTGIACLHLLRRRKQQAS